MQRQLRADAARLEVEQLLAVVYERRIVELAGLRLDPCPPHAKPVVAHALGFHERRVF